VSNKYLVSTSKFVIVPAKLFISCGGLIENTLLIGAEGTKTPAGVRGRGDPAGAMRRGSSPRNARGKRSAWSANQQTSLKAYAINIAAESLSTA
jgi:hypothetical protein